MKIFAVHWSDNKEKYGIPFYARKDLRSLGMPFLYFKAMGQVEAVKIVKQLPPFYDLFKKSVRKQMNFDVWLGSYEL